MHKRDVVIPDGEKRTEPIVVEATESMELCVQVGKEASVFVVCLHAGISGTPVEILERGTIDAGGTLHWFNVTLGSGVTQDLRSECVGDHATSSVDWIFYAQGSEKQSLSVRNVFSGRDGGGEIVMKGVAEERGHASAKGMIEIGLQGGGTNTYLTQEVLMLDPTSKVDAVPGLEIKTNDVKASHSASVARVTPEDLFYFASRGIPAEIARPMFIEGFLGDLVAAIDDQGTRELILAELIEKLGRKKASTTT